MKYTISPVSWGWNRSDIWVYSAWRGSDLDWFFPSASSSRKKLPALTSRKEDGPTCHSLSASAPRRADNKDDIPEYKTGRYRVKEIEDINCVGRDSTWVQHCNSDMWAMCFWWLSKTIQNFSDLGLDELLPCHTSFLYCKYRSYFLLFLLLIHFNAERVVARK